tara:strand:- start:296 stop:487 length:192 start_codon:yes stop_codon:yes gene_type:complete
LVEFLNLKYYLKSGRSSVKLNDISSDAPTRVNSKITTLDLTGLGIEPNFGMSGDTVLTFLKNY